MKTSIIGVALAAGLAIGSMARAGQQKAYPFFPFCIDWHDAKHRSFDEQAVMLKDLGYDGVGHIWLDGVAQRLKTLDDAGLKLFQITMVVDITPGKPAYDPRFKDVLALVKGRHVQFALLVNGAKPSDATADARGVEVLRGMSDLARDSGSQLLLYPHVGDWIERIEDCVRVAEKVDRPNVGVMFNLCHWLRVDKQRDYRPLLERALPRLWAVSINGADVRDERPGWDHYIQPLDKGSFDVGGLLHTLKELGYQGPIGLQCFGIGGDAREHLARSMAAWRKLSENLGPDAIDAEIARLKQAGYALVDFHIHLKGGLTAEEAVALSRRSGIKYGIAANCGLKFPITDDAGIERLRRQPQGPAGLHRHAGRRPRVAAALLQAGHRQVRLRLHRRHDDRRPSRPTGPALDQGRGRYPGQAGLHGTAGADDRSRSSTTSRSTSTPIRPTCPTCWPRNTTSCGPPSG